MRRPDAGGFFVAFLFDELDDRVSLVDYYGGAVGVFDLAVGVVVGIVEDGDGFLAVGYTGGDFEWYVVAGLAVDGGVFGVFPVDWDFDFFLLALDFYLLDVDFVALFIDDLGVDRLDFDFVVGAA